MSVRRAASDAAKGAGASPGRDEATSRVRRLRASLGLTLVILAIELIGSAASGSVALLGDAGHVLTDVAALGLAWFAAAQSAHPATQHATFGRHRLGILAALANAVALLGVVAGVTVEAAMRLRSPSTPALGPMAGAAAAGVGINLVVIGWLRDSGHHDLNTRAAALHVAGDIGASVAVIVAAGVIGATGWQWVDPALSLAVAVVIAVGAWRILGEAGAILMESTPRDLSVPDLVAAVSGVHGVTGIHDLHVWSIDGTRRALSAHVGVATNDLGACAPLLAEVNAVLSARFGISHATLQLECTDCAPASDVWCVLESSPTHPTDAPAASPPTTGAGRG